MASEDLMAYMAGQENRGSGDMFGGNGLWGLLALALVFGGGFGGFGGWGGGGGQALTRAELYDGFAIQNIDSAVRGVQQGIADSTYALNNAVTSGFYGVDRGLCDLRAQLAQCCCDNRAAVADLKYTMASEFCGLGNTIQNSTRDIIDNQNAGTRAILDFLTQDKIATLTAENQNLKFQASQVAQNQFITQVGSDIVNRLQPPPVPAYTVPNPYAGYGYGGCGCGC